MLFAGASAASKVPTTSSTAIQPPFSAVIAVSSITLLNSFFGLSGACCAISRDGDWRVSCCSNRLLMAYYVIVLLMCSGLFYLMLLCFLFAAKAADFIEAYWVSWSELFPQGQLSQEQVHRDVGKYANLAGSLCLFTMLINILSAHLSAIVMGYRYTTRKSIMIINLVGFVVGLVMIILAFLPATRDVGVQKGWLPELIGSIGVMVIFFAIFGFTAAYYTWAAFLLINGVLELFFAALLLSMAIVCFIDSKRSGSVLAGQWSFIQEKLINVCPSCAGEVNQEMKQNCCSKQASLVIWRNLTVLGVSASTCVMLMCMNGASR
ncbi:hypothetical protein GUITHDRAFT_121339 [Guillardia theta CCMP2712]|uniref:Uncharacterized protein n=1 Tax=Guillardia theta (strain CCMP2712) TaxID=905079 RepID=L1I8C4_GUITC|nr:hypothetical protein GUITHDRAFT_121339 [Guillardia theta CCMP2712]EKX32483.1 hypothetical protein GUITHDRAFT_121339 [Guillardia theta CCMP2712]|eukprot:XP_005819463.1 hypothetical protein GUITHDRAFT_121339 [Guillardia theta CCMP2712]